MKKKDLEEFKKILKERRKKLVEQLESFAKKEKGREDWSAKFPKFDGEVDMERVADEVEEYASLLSLEYNLESQIQEIDRALERIKNGTFGTCKKCKKEIEKERLRVNPTTEICQKCAKK